VSQPSCAVCSAPSDSQLCTRCYTTLERNLAELPALWDELTVTRSRQDRITRSKAGIGHSAPLPINMAAMIDADDLHNTLSTWVRTVISDEGIEQWPADTAQAMAAWLVSYLGWARRSAEAGQFFDEIAYISDAVRRTIDRPEVRWYAGPCKAIAVITETVGGVIVVRQGPCPGQLYGRPGKDELKCDGYQQPDLHLGRADADGNPVRGCGATDSAVARREYLRAEAEDALAPLDVLLDSLDVLGIPAVSKWAVWWWVHGGQLLPHGLDRRGVELYRGGDLFALAERAKTPSTCQQCGSPMAGQRKRKGDPKRFCSPKCRTAAHRSTPTTDRISA
jgi:hypothetical protein